MQQNPQYFGPYELVRPLGVGGMAETFVANRRGPGGFEQRVALKRVLPAYSRDPRFVEQFLQEARLAAALRHSNIVGVIDFGEQDGTYYMAMELVEGCDLRKLMSEQPGDCLPVPLAIQVILDLAYALDYAHSAELDDETEGLVHRDISPANVLMSRSGGVRLADFGIAKAMRGMTATASSVVKGKIPYMAPEQMRGKALDGRADIFSLGVVFWELIVGSRPFDGENDIDTMSRIATGERPPLAIVAPELNPVLVSIIEDMIAIHADDRIASAEALVDRLTVLGLSPKARRELGTLVTVINPKPDRTTSSTPTRPSGGGAPPHAAGGPISASGQHTAPNPSAMTTPLEGFPARDSGQWNQATHSASGQAHPGPHSGSHDQWSSPERTGERPPTAQASGAKLVMLALGAALVAVIGTLGAQTLIAPTPPPVQSTESVSPPEQPPSVPPTVPPEQPAQDIAPPSTAEAETSDIAGADTTEGDEAELEPEELEPEEPKPDTGEASPRNARSARRGTPARPARREPPPRTAPAAMTASSAAPATLRVAVIPWGNVSIDGRARGRAPVSVSVPPGRHTIVVRGDGPPQRRSVTLRSGQTRQVVFD